MPKSLPQIECSRRALLEGIGVAALGSLLLGGCTSNGANLPSATTTTCGSSTCIDLTDATNSDLTQVGGSMVIDAASDTIIVARTSATEVVALSAICTHAGCTVELDANGQQLDCPCHGSEFALDGSVLRGPASRALKVYTATLANNMITVAT